MNIGHVQRMGEFPVGRIARVRNQIDFGEPRRGHVPTIRLHRNLMLQQQPRLGPPVDAPLLLPLLCPQTAIHLPRTDPQQLTLDFPAHPKALSTEPTRDKRRLHRLPPGSTAPEDHSCIRAAAPLSPAPSPDAARSDAESHTSGDSRCSHRTRLRSPASASAPPDDTVGRSLESTPTSPSAPCPTLLKIASESGYILNGATIPPSVTF